MTELTSLEISDTVNINIRGIVLAVTASVNHFDLALLRLTQAYFDHCGLIPKATKWRLNENQKLKEPALLQL